MIVTVFPSRNKEYEDKFTQHILSTIATKTCSTTGITDSIIKARKAAYTKFLTNPEGDTVYSVDDDIKFTKEHLKYINAAEKLLKDKGDVYSGVLFISKNDVYLKSQICKDSAICDIIDGVNFYNVSGEYNDNSNDKILFERNINKLWMSGGIMCKPKALNIYMSSKDNIYEFEDRLLLYIVASMGKIVVCSSEYVEHTRDVYSETGTIKTIVLPGVIDSDLPANINRIHGEHINFLKGKFLFNKLNFNNR